jgi:hypothetical protein
MGMNTIGREVKCGRPKLQKAKRVRRWKKQSARLLESGAFGIGLNGVASGMKRLF